MDRPQLHVRLISRWAVNPYQKLLVAHLQERGLTISEESPTLRHLTFRGRPHILHLQNIRPSLTSAGTLESLTRVLHFATRLLLARLNGTRIVWTAHDLESPSSRHPILDRLVTALHGHYIGYYPDSIPRSNAAPPSASATTKSSSCSAVVLDAKIDEFLSARSA